MNKPPTIAFDCDDVLMNLRRPLGRVIAEETGYTVPWSDWHDYDLAERAGITLTRFAEIMLSRRVLEKATLEIEAAAVFSELRAAGFELQVWTARAWHPQALDITAEQLAPLVTPDAIRLFDVGECKGTAAVASNITALVDDNAAPIHALAGSGVAGVVMDRPWNRRYQTLARCFDLAGAQDMLLKNCREKNDGSL